MDYTPDNPFTEVEQILKRIQTKIILVELHAEATSEKLAMGWMLDGKAYDFETPITGDITLTAAWKRRIWTTGTAR